MTTYGPLAWVKLGLFIPAVGVGGGINEFGHRAHIIYVHFTYEARNRHSAPLSLVGDLFA